MHIKGFKSFSLGGLGGKSKKDSPASKYEQVAEIAELEAKVTGKTKALKKATDKLNGLKTSAGIEIPLDVPPVRPHGPAAELTLEAEDLSDSAGITLDEVDEVIIDDSVKPGEEIKVKEVIAEKIGAVKTAPVAAVVNSTSKAPATAVPAAAPAAEKKEEKKEEKPEDNDSLNNLFSQDEEEENPLASLIANLPDVTARELMDDLSEIHRIIKEWNPSKK